MKMTTNCITNTIVPVGAKVVVTNNNGLCTFIYNEMWFGYYSITCFNIIL